MPYADAEAAGIEAVHERVRPMARNVLQALVCGPSIRNGPARLLFVVYGREATRINSHHEWLISIVIACSAEHYGIYW